MHICTTGLAKADITESVCGTLRKSELVLSLFSNLFCVLQGALSGLDVRDRSMIQSHGYSFECICDGVIFKRVINLKIFDIAQEHQITTLGQAFQIF